MELRREVDTVATMILSVEVDDDADASNFVYLLFGPHEDAEAFGDYVSEHEFTLSRVNE